MIISELLSSAGDRLFAIEDGSIFLPRITVAQITADQNAYDPGHGFYFRISTDAARAINGWVSKGSGQFVTIVQTSAFNLTLTHQSATPSAGDRILCASGASIVLAQNEMAQMIWDVTTNRWRAWKL